LKFFELFFYYFGNRPETISNGITSWWKDMWLWNICVWSRNCMEKKLVGFGEQTVCLVYLDKTFFLLFWSFIYFSSTTRRAGRKKNLSAKVWYVMPTWTAFFSLSATTAQHTCTVNNFFFLSYMLFALFSSSARTGFRYKFVVKKTTATLLFWYYCCKIMALVLLANIHHSINRKSECEDNPFLVWKTTPYDW